MEEKPGEVLALEQKLEGEGIWFITTNNHNNQEAHTCKDAIHKRNRLGHSKIPLFCELKSFLGFYSENGIRKYLMAHCRGNQRIDLNKIKNIIGAKVKRLNNAKEILEIIGISIISIEGKRELQNLFGPGVGLINPFCGFDRLEMRQIFDESLTTQNFIPYTMITNASHRRWGVEFKPKELIDYLPNSVIKDIVDDSNKFSIQKQIIGILTGNSPESGMLLWEKINMRIRDNFGEKYFLGDISFPEVIIDSIPEMGLSMELDLRYDIIYEIVKKGVTNLCERGATIVCIACNTTQYFSELLKEICSKYEATYVSIPEVTIQYLRREKIKEIDFLGIKYVSDFEKWSAFKNLKEEFDLNMPKEEDINKIYELAFEVKKKGRLSGSGIQNLVRLIDKSTKTDTILLALTELSITFKSHGKSIIKKSKKLYLDTLTILAEAIGDMYTTEHSSEIKTET